MIYTYPACFYVDDDGITVIFPDLNYLASQGETIDDAMKKAIDCLAGYIYEAKLTNDKINKASELKDISLKRVAKELGFDNEINESFVNLVSVDVDEYAKIHFEKTIKKTLTIPSYLNDLAIKNNINFSKVLKEALEDILL